MNSLRDTAMALFQAAIQQADPAAAVHRHLAATPLPDLAPDARRYIIAVGKAAVPMMRAALEGLPEPEQAVVVTNPENICDLPGAQVLAGAHPVPDHSSAAAGETVLELLRNTAPGDQVLALISGGGSALMVAPKSGVSLAEKSAANAVLLGSGLDIGDMNLVRQQISGLKGGGLLQAAAPATVHALLLSDVIGDDLRAIASGPTVAPLGNRATALSLLQARGILAQMPEAVQTLLATPEPPPADLPAAHNHLIGSNRQSLLAMEQAADALGWEARIVSDALTGDVEEAAAEICQSFADLPTDRPCAFLFGGETTVRLRGSGLGGRNQELALRVAQTGAERPGNWVFLSGGTDGRDGPTDAAGACVDAGSWARITESGADPHALLSNNDSNAALRLAGDLLVVGGTGTNVADVQILLHRPQAAYR